MSTHNAKFASNTKPFAERFDFLSPTGLDRSLDHMARTKLAEQNSLVQHQISEISIPLIKLVTRTLSCYNTNYDLLRKLQRTNILICVIQ